MSARKIGLFVLPLLLLSACATQPTPEVYNPPGFFMGFFHGAILPFSLIGSLFWHIRIYAFPNSGWWYDFGFSLGLTTLVGGSGRAATHR